MEKHRTRIGRHHERSNEFNTLSHWAIKLREECSALSKSLKKLHRRIGDQLTGEEKEKEHFELPMVELNSWANRLEDLGQGLTVLFDLEAENRELFVHFFSVIVRKSNVYPAFHSLPIIVSKPMVEHCFKRFGSMILVSGTLTARKNFSFIQKRLGLSDEEIVPEPITGTFPSPFDYSKQARLFIPSDFPEPNHPEYISRITKPVFDIVNSSQGGTLVLCTSYAHLNQLYTALSSQLSAYGFECYKQGELERHYLLELFQEDGNAVLFATDSFWEGVDIPGNALRNLVITKLPFAIPNDPVLEARQEKIREEGGNPFRDYQLPMASIKLKQGFGRLIRKKSDRGTVWILDRRIVTKSYGSFFLESLPPIPVFRGKFRVLINKAENFFEENYKPQNFQQDAFLQF